MRAAQSDFVATLTAIGVLTLFGACYAIVELCIRNGALALTPRHHLLFAIAWCAAAWLCVSFTHRRVHTRLRKAAQAPRV